MRLSVPERLRASDISKRVKRLQQFVVHGRSRRKRYSDTFIANIGRLEHLWWNETLIGYGIAEKRSGGRNTELLCVRFYVRRKLPKQKLKSIFRIPPSVDISHGNGEPIPVVSDVVEVRRCPAAQRSVFAGDSIGHYIGLNGTLGL